MLFIQKKFKYSKINRCLKKLLCIFSNAFRSFNLDSVSTMHYNILSYYVKQGRGAQ
jgi:hypothetical protein